MMPPRLVSCCAAALPRQQDGECSGAAATQPWSHHRSIPRRLLEPAVVDRNVGLDLLDRDLLPVLAALATALDRIRQVPAGDLLVVAERRLELLLRPADHALLLDLDGDVVVGIHVVVAHVAARERDLRSEERRVGKECRSRWSPYH